MVSFIGSLWDLMLIILLGLDVDWEYPAGMSHTPPAIFLTNTLPR
jgi:GH18 family chitinase